MVPEPVRVGSHAALPADLTDDERTDLQDQILGLAWAFARRAAGFGRAGTPANPNGTGAVRPASGPATPITRSGHADDHPVPPRTPGQFTKLDAVAVLMARLLPAPQKSAAPGSSLASSRLLRSASYGLGRRTRTGARPATPGTISDDYALELCTASCMAPAHLSQARGRSRSSFRSSFTVPRRPVNHRCHRGGTRYPHSTSSADSFVRRLVCHGQHAGVPRP